MSFKNKHVDFDDDFDDQQQRVPSLPRAPQVARYPTNDFSISDEEEVASDDSSSVASVAKLAAIANDIAKLDSSTGSNQLDNSSSSQQNNNKDNNDHLNESVGSGISGGSGAEHNNLDESVNDQMKEIYDYFKEQTAADDEDSLQHSSENSSLNTSSTAATTAAAGGEAKQENLATIMGDVLKIHSNVAHALSGSAAKDNNNNNNDDAAPKPSQTYDEDGYDKIERAEIMRAHISDEGPLEFNVKESSDDHHDHDDLDISVTDALRAATKILDVEHIQQAPPPITLTQHPNNKFGLTNDQYEAVAHFYKQAANPKGDTQLLSSSLLRPLMAESLKTRSDVLQASEHDIDRALETVDRDQDDAITLDEFIELLLLFFSSRHNLAQRLETVVKAKSASSDSDDENLKPNDAIELTSFLNDFYGKSNTEADLFNTLDLNLSLNAHKFIGQLAPKLESAAYVNWEKKQRSEHHDEDEHEQQH